MFKIDTVYSIYLARKLGQKMRKTPENEVINPQRARKLLTPELFFDDKLTVI